MRILQFGRFWDNQHGGIERHVNLLCTGLAEAGVSVVNLVSSRDARTHTKYINGFELVQAATFGNIFSTSISPALLQLAWKLHQNNPFDVFHLHFPDPLTHLASKLLPKDVPRVITWHSDIIKQRRLMRLYRPFLQAEVLRSKALVAATPAHFQSSQIPNSHPKCDQHVIPYGIDFNTLQMDPQCEKLRDHLRLQSNNRPLLFSLGRHVYYKGFDVLLNALTHTQAYLILGGDGPLRESLQRQAAALSVADRVFFTGRIPEKDLPAYFHACDIFVLPSVEPSEAFGLVQLEAMACGKPSICTQLNNGVNVVNPNGITGLTVPVQDPISLAHAINLLTSDIELRMRLGRQAKVHALTNYSSRAMTELHLKLYQSLLSTRR